MKSLTIYSSVLIFLIAVHPGWTKVIYVNHAAIGENNGSSWTDAYVDLQDALAAAEVDDEIWVAEGIYTPDVAFGDRVATFKLENGISILGGFAGSEESAFERDPDTQPTILSGDLNQDDVGFENNGENSYHVVTSIDADSKVVLDGFTIRNGNADSGPDPHYSGGGILIINGNPAIRNCKFTNNMAGYGGAIACLKACPEILNCKFTNNIADEFTIEHQVDSEPAEINQANEFSMDNQINFGSTEVIIAIPPIDQQTVVSVTSMGGAFYCVSSKPSVVDCLFMSNSAKSGAAVANIESQPSYGNCNFIMNQATSITNFNVGRGGGMYNNQSTSLVSSCSFAKNSATEGGAVYNFSSDASFVNNIFTGNTAYKKGGGVFNLTSAPVFINVLFNGNSANSLFKSVSGGCMFNKSSSPHLTNCTVVNNSATVEFEHFDNQNGVGGGIFSAGASFPVIHNSLFKGNTHSHHSFRSKEYIDTDSSDTLISYCLIQRMVSTDNDGNISGDPLFVDADGDDDVAGTLDDDFRLSALSPAIDAGNIATVPNDIADLDHDADTDERLPVDISGNPRIANRVIDIGAYEAVDDTFAITAAKAGEDAIDDGIPDYYLVRKKVDTELLQVMLDTNGSKGRTAVEVFSEFQDNTPRLTVVGSDDSDTLVIDHGNGLISVPITFVGGNDSNFLIINGTSNADGLELREGSVLFESVLTRFSDIDSLQINTGDDSDSLTVVTTSDYLIPSLIYDGGNSLDSLAAGSRQNGWNITDINRGELNTLQFKNVEHLIGNNDKDYFSFQPGGRIDGSIDGSNGDDTLDYTDYGGTDITITKSDGNEFSGTETTSLGDGFLGIELLTGVNPKIEINDSGAAEGEEITFIIKLTYSITKPVYVDYRTIEGEATEDIDYSAVSGTVVFLPGEDEKTIIVDSSRDNDVEEDETFIIQIASSENADLVDDKGVGTIFDVAAPIFVNRNAQGSGDGTNWENAFNDLQSALTSVEAGDEIWVSSGTYKPAASGGSRDAVFEIPRGIKVLGAFPVGAISKYQRDFHDNETILSGDLNDDDHGFTNNRENSFHVVSIVNGDPATSLDGFTITGGNNEGEGAGVIFTGSPHIVNCRIIGNYANRGPGIYSSSSFSNARLENCVIKENLAVLEGGAVYAGFNHGSNPLFINCDFIRNRADNNGGAVCARLSNGSSLTFLKCLFEENKTVSGGSIYVDEFSKLMIRGCTFRNNQASDYGGAIYNLGNSIDVTNTRFINNSAGLSGGAIYSLEDDFGHSFAPQFINCTFLKNVSTKNGGGIYDHEKSSSTLINCLFSGNESSKGGGLYSHRFFANPTLINCTLSGNRATIGGGIYNFAGALKVTNSILWGNIDQGDTGLTAQISQNGSSDAQFVNSIIQGWDDAGGGAALDIDPLFIDSDGADDIIGTEDDNLQVLTTSPAINSGDSSYLPQDGSDINDNGITSEPVPLDLMLRPRVLNGAVDIGAYENPEQHVLITADDSLYGSSGDGIADHFKITVDDLTGIVSIHLDTPGSDENVSEIFSGSIVDLSMITLTGSSDPDVFTIDQSNGLTDIPIFIEGRDGDNQLIIKGTENMDLLVLANQSVFNGVGAVSFDGIPLVRVQMQGGDDQIRVHDNVTLQQNILIESGEGYDTIIGPNVSITWNITGFSTGRFWGIEFGGIESLQGGSGSDTFAFHDGAFIDGSIDGSAGDDDLDYTDFGDSNITITKLTSEGYSGSELNSLASGFTRIEFITGIESLLSINSTTLFEGESAEFAVSLSVPIENTVSVDYRSSDDTADEFEDYFPVQGTLHFSPGEMKKTLTVVTTNDSESELDESFHIQLENPINAKIGTYLGSATLSDYRAPIYVDKFATGNNDGSDWTNAYTDLQNALSVANSNDLVWVATGTYKPTTKIAGDREASFQLKSGIKIFGGFPTGGSAFFDRNSLIYATKLSGDILGDDDGFTNNSENCFHVVTATDTDFGTVIDGFHIIGGNANREGFRSGGGIKIENGTVTVTNCIISNNYGVFGGGISDLSSSSTISNCTITGNEASDGGGIYHSSSNSILNNCVISRNHASSFGGGQRVLRSSSLSVINCTFDNNNADDEGGGVSTYYSSNDYVNCKFFGNSSGDNGGAIYFENNAPHLTNSIFSGNDTLDSGGGIYNENADPILINCSFSNNTAGVTGGAIYNYFKAFPVITNCVFWDNTAGASQFISNISNSDSASPTISYSLIQSAGESNSIFIDADGNDNIFGTVDDNLQLRPDSNALNSGNNASLPIDAFDLDFDDDVIETIPFDLRNRPRILNDFVDMGAIESPEQVIVISAEDFGVGLAGDGIIDTFKISLDNSQEILTLSPGDDTTEFIILTESITDISTIEINGSSDDDILILDESNGSLGTTVEFIGGDGENSLKYLGTEEADSILTSGHSIIAGFTLLTYEDISSLTVDTSIGNDRILLKVTDDLPENCVFDGSSGVDILIGPDIATSWQVNGINEGKLSSYLFRNIENLNGGSDDDLFLFSDGSMLDGIIDGKSGIDSIDYSEISDIDLIVLEKDMHGFRGREDGTMAEVFSGIDLFLGAGAPTISIQDQTLYEGETAQFVISLSFPISEPVMVDYQIRDEETDVNSDYINAQGTIVFSPGEYVKIISVSTARDLLVESTETFVLELMNYTNALIHDPEAIGTILDGKTPICVNESASGNNDGSDWVNAFTSLQSAISSSQDDDEIWVARGQYLPAAAGGNRNDSFRVIHNVSLFGGFFGDEDSLFQRDPGRNPTILSGDLVGDDIGTLNNAENSFHVIEIIGDLEKIIIDGFTISGGNAGENDGGGILIDGSAVTLKNLTFIGNSAASGGALYEKNSTTLIQDCLFIGNEAESGGAIRSSSLLTVKNCLFRNNLADDEGGGLLIDSRDTTISDCIFLNNTAAFGGAVSNGISSSPLLKECIFEGNFARTGGGGIYNRTSFAHVFNCIFIGNSSSGSGGAIYNTDNLGWVSGGSGPRYTNCVIRDNFATLNGGGIFNIPGPTANQNCIVTDDWDNCISFCWACNVSFNQDPAYFMTPELTNCLIFQNRATIGGGMFSYFFAKPTITNSIFWKNTHIDDDVFQAQIKNNNDFPLTYSSTLIEGHEALDPNFNPGLTVDGHLIIGSGIIDLGTNATDMESDRDHEVRRHGENTDIGPDEYIDSDNDGLPDYLEMQITGTLIEMAPDSDNDKDGLSNFSEYTLSTNPENPDTDLDGRWDGEEMFLNPERNRFVNVSDPLHPDSALSPYKSIYRYSTILNEKLQHVVHSLLADMNGDGDLDLICSQADGKIEYYENSGSLVNPDWDDGIQIHSISGQPAVGDVDGDGDIDLVVQQFRQLVLVKNMADESDNSIRFAAPEAININYDMSRSTRMYLADVVNSDRQYASDNLLDIIVIDDDGRIGLIKNNGADANPQWDDPDFSWAGATRFNPAFDTSGDIDLDGDLDRFAGLNANGIPVFDINTDEHLIIRPRYLTLVQGELQQFQTEGGHGGVLFSLVQDTSGATITNDGIYTAGTENTGVDVIRAVAEDGLSGLVVVNVISLEEADRNTKVLIVVGTRSVKDSLLSTSERLAMDAYVVCRQRGYRASDICLLTPNGTLSKSAHLGFPIDAEGDNGELETAIKDWASDVDDLILYFVDHGVVREGLGNLVLRPGTYLNSEMLKAWLDDWQTQKAERTSLVTIDTCYSGHFVEELAFGSPQRIVMAATGSGALAHFQGNGAISFSQLFWDEIAAGSATHDAFLTTVDNLAETLDQVPLIDVNGDGSPENPEMLGELRGIGLGDLVGGVQRPAIGTVIEDININESSTTLWCMDVVSNNGIQRVIAYIVPPTLQTEVEDRSALTDMASVELVDYIAQRRIPKSDFECWVKPTENDDFECEQTLSETPSCPDHPPIIKADKEFLCSSYTRNGEFYELNTELPTFVLQRLRTIEEQLGYPPRYEADWEEFDTPGLYRILFFAEDNWGMLSTVRSARVTVEGPGKKAIIIECHGITDMGTPWSSDEIRKQAQLVRQTLHNRSFAAEDIQWFGPGHQAANKATIADVLTSDFVEDIDELTLYWVGNATTEGVLLTDDDRVTPLELKGWLDTLQSRSPCRVTVVVETDYSGSFLAGLANPDYERYVVSSTDSVNRTLRSSGLTFGNWFWGEVRRGRSIQQAFIRSKAIARASQIQPIPFSLDDDGNGIYEKKKDGLRASDKFIGTLFLTGDDEVQIGSVSKSLVLNPGDSGLLFVKDAFSPDGADLKVSATLIQADTGEIMTDALTMVSTGSGQYQRDIRYDDFPDPGRYVAMIQAASLNDSTLSVVPVPVDIFVGIAPPESNGVVEDTYPRLVVGDDATSAELDDSGQDIYRLWAVVSQAITIDLENVSEGADVRLAILADPQETDTPLEEADDAPAGSDEFIISWNPPDTGWYYVQVEAIAVNESPVSYSIEATSQHFGADGYEEDDLPEMAKWISWKDGDFQEHNFHDEGDEDWLFYYALEEPSYEITVSEEGVNCDVILELYEEVDGDFSLLQQVDQTQGNGEIISQTGDKTPGRYYVRIRNANPQVHGVGTGYRIEIKDTSGFIPGILMVLIHDNFLNEQLLTGTVSAAGLDPFDEEDKVYILDEVPAGAHEVTVSVSGYQPNPASQSVDVQANDLTEAHFNLTPISLSDRTVSLKKGWNMTSLPFIPRDNRVETVFQDYPQFGEVWSWREGRLQPALRLWPMTGYWVYCHNQEAPLSIQGMDVVDTTKTLSKGWNLFGAAANTPLPETIEGPIWYWDDGIFKKAQTLKAGRGYWMYTDEPVTIDFDTAPETD